MVLDDIPSGMKSVLESVIEEAAELTGIERQQVIINAIMLYCGIARMNPKPGYMDLEGVGYLDIRPFFQKYDLDGEVPKEGRDTKIIDITKFLKKKDD